MDPVDDPELTAMLKEWNLPGAPPSLDARVLGTRRSWWSFLITGSIRVPVPVMGTIVMILLVMAFALLRKPPSTPVSARINLADFRPVQDLNVRVIRGNNDAK